MMSLPFIFRWNLLSPCMLTLGLGGLWLGGGLNVAVAVQPAAQAAETPAELTAAARDYRIEIYGAFRQNRVEYDQRRKQAEALLNEWQTRGALPDEAALLVRWFEDARRAATRQLPPPSAPNWNGAVAIVPLPPNDRLSHSAGQTPLLRALPTKRQRTVQQVQLTALSAVSIHPQESNDTLKVIEALPTISSLNLVLALPDPNGLEQSIGVNLTKKESASTLQVSDSNPVLPVAKLNPNTLAGTNTKSTKEETAELNTAELRARLRGYDKAWRALQSDLYSDEELTLDRAATLLGILSDLKQARSDLQLYQAIAPEGLREELRGLSALDELQKHLRQVVENARTNTMADHTLAPGERARLERAWLIFLERLKQ